MPDPQQWEYKIARAIQPGYDEKVLAEAGADGWELVHVGTQSLYFKRPRTVVELEPGDAT